MKYKQDIWMLVTGGGIGAFLQAKPETKDFSNLIMQLAVYPSEKEAKRALKTTILADMKLTIVKSTLKWTA